MIRRKTRPVQPRLSATGAAWRLRLAKNHTHQTTAIRPPPRAPGPAGLHAGTAHQAGGRGTRRMAASGQASMHNRQAWQSSGRMTYAWRLPCAHALILPTTDNVARSDGSSLRISKTLNGHTCTQPALASHRLRSITGATRPASPLHCGPISFCGVFWLVFRAVLWVVLGVVFCMTGKLFRCLTPSAAAPR